jgi:hypothetical protein
MFALRDALRNALPERLQSRFQAVVWRLLATGVIARHASQKEADLYDRGVDMAEVLVDLFAALGLPFHHDATAQTLRLFAPGATIPGVPVDQPETYGRITLPVSADLAAGLIALWLLYREGVERNLLNQRGERVILLEDLDACMVSQLRNTAMQRLTDRRELLTEFRQLRVARLPDNGANMEVGDALAIQRGILSLIFDTAAEAALARPAKVSAEAQS